MSGGGRTSMLRAAAGLAAGPCVARRALVGLATVIGASAAAAQLPAPPALVISPPSGEYYQTQSFDLLLITVGDVAVTGGTATLDGTDVTTPLQACLVAGSLGSGGRTFRCPGVSSALTVGSHVLAVELTLDDGTRLEATVAWEIQENVEP